MIFTESTIKISNNVSKMDSTIVLYRGDKNVEIRFTILQSPFKYSNTVATNVIESTNASFGQLVIKTPNDKPPIFSDVSATKEGTVLFTITKEMIDEIEELGNYTFQIRLMDENKQSRVTIPPVENGIEIKEPIAIEDDNTTNVVGLAKANYAVATLSDVDTPTFDNNGKYNKTNWNDGDIITNASLNKIEDGIYTTNEKTSILPIKHNYTIFKDAVPSLKQDTASTYGAGGGDDTRKLYVFNNLQNTDMIVAAVEFNIIVSFNDGTADITKNIVYKNNSGTSFGVYEDGYIVNLVYIADENLIELSVTKLVITDTGNQEISCTITKATFICSLYSNLLQNYAIEDIKYNQITQVPDKLDGLVIGRYEVFNNEDYYYLYDNSFVWDMNRINERLDEKSGVTQNTTVNTIARKVIKVNQKDSEGIGFGQLVPINNKRDVSIIAKAGVDVILKAYNPNTKKLLLTMNFRDRNSFEVIKGYISKNQLSGLNNIFIAFTTTETPANYDFNSNVDYLVVTDEHTFLKRAEVLTKENTKEYIPTGDYNPATKKYVDDNTPIKSLPVNPTTKTGAVVDVNNLTVSGCYALPKRTDGKHWTNLIMRAMINDGSGKGKSIMLSGYQNYVFHVNIETKKIYCDNLRIVYNIGTTADTTDIRTEPYFLPTTNTKEFTPTKEYHPATKKYVDDNKIAYIKSETVAETIDTSPMISSFKNNSYVYESNNVTYLEMGKEYHVIVNGVRYRALCINNMPGNDQIYETIAVNGNGFSISIMNKFGYNTKYYPDNTKCAYEIKLSDELLAAPPTIQILKMDIEYIPTYLMPKDLGILNSISINRIGDIGTGSVAIGYNNTASNDFTFAMGVNTTAIATAAHAEGGYTVANASYSHAEGFKSASTGEYSHVEGIVCESSGQGSHAEGYYTVASGQRSHSEGCFTEAASQYQHVQGKYNVVDSNGVYAHIVGNGTGKNNRHNAHTLDWQGNAWFAGEVQGTNLPYTISSKVLTTVPASNIKLDESITVNNVSINGDRRYYIEFLGSKKLGSLSIDEEIGNAITCSINNYAIEIFNDSSNISMRVSKINRDDTTATTFTNLVIYEEEVKYLDNKYLETDLTLHNSISLGRIGDIGTGSSAIGYDVEASGNFSHAEGNNTAASGYASHAEGSTTTASGVSSHAEGDYTTASGASSHAEGYGSKASSQFQHVQGKYNIEDKDRKYAHIVGNGAGDAKRSNAHTLDWKGNSWYSGKLSQEGTPTEDKDLTTKKYVDDKVASLPQLSFNEAGELVVTINGVSKTFVPKNV